MIRIALFVSLAVGLVAAGVALAAGNPTAGKKVFQQKGCGSCHVFKPAGSTGKIGPALNKVRLTADSKRAKQSYNVFIRTSIVAPKTFIAPGYKPLMPTLSLTKKQLDDVVAFIATG